ncbi:MAG TPA: hypothetical protein VMG34_12720 [Bacteroidota bacterium]|nr:hypothetical protein [Bacteroidota bacterium]
MKTVSVLSCFILGAIACGCSSLTLSPVEYQWPVESVLRVDEKGSVEEPRYNMVFNVKPLLFEETADSTHVSGVQLRVIRDMSGYYFITAPKFKNVYVFASDEGKLKLEKKILINEKGLASPALNQAPPFIHLLNGKEKPIVLSKDGIQQGGQK